MAQLGDREAAVKLLRDAFSKGYAYTIDLHRDETLEPLRDYPLFQKLMQPR